MCFCVPHVYFPDNFWICETYLLPKNMCRLCCFWYFSHLRTYPHCLYTSPNWLGIVLLGHTLLRTMWKQLHCILALKVDNFDVSLLFPCCRWSEFWRPKKDFFKVTLKYLTQHIISSWGFYVQVSKNKVSFHLYNYFRKHFLC